MSHKQGREIFPLEAADGGASFASFGRSLLEGLGAHHDSVHQVLHSLKQDVELLMSTFSNLVDALKADDAVIDGAVVVMGKTNTVLAGILTQLEALKTAPSVEQIDATIADVKGHIDALATATSALTTAADAVSNTQAPPAASPPTTPPPAAAPVASDPAATV